MIVMNLRDGKAIAVRHRKGPPSQRSAIAKGQGGLYRPKGFELNGRVYKGLKSLMLTFYCKEVAVSTTG